MINKFENENEKEKLFKQKRASLIEHFMRTLDRISVSLYISKALNSFSYENLSIFKAKLNKYFCPSFPENKIHSSTHHMHICSNFPVKQRRMAKKQAILITGHKQAFLSWASLSCLLLRCPEEPQWYRCRVDVCYKVSFDLVLVKNCYVNFLIF